MKLNRIIAVTLVLTGSVVAPQTLMAQGTIADYQRAMTLRDKYTGKAFNIAEAPRWIEQTSRFYYRKSVKGGNEWVVVDGTTKEKKPPFDHARLADAIAKATGRKATALELPFTTFTFVDNERSIEFTLGGGPGGARGGGPGPASRRRTRRAGSRSPTTASGRAAGWRRTPGSRAWADRAVGR